RPCLAGSLASSSCHVPLLPKVEFCSTHWYDSPGRNDRRRRGEGDRWQPGLGDLPAVLPASHGKPWNGRPSCISTSLTRSCRTSVWLRTTFASCKVRSWRRPSAIRSSPAREGSGGSGSPRRGRRAARAGLVVSPAASSVLPQPFLLRDALDI